MHVARAERPHLVVAISGCDTGFGRDLALSLAADDGFVVLAGCLQPAKAQELDALKVPGLHAAPLDVTQEASVAAFAARLAAVVAASEGGGRPPRRLHAVVNNAGVGTGGAVDWLTIEGYKFDMEVNYFGMIRLTKACLPLLKAAAVALHVKRHRRSPTAAKTFSFAPRIINMTSTAGLVAAPFLSPYCGSKHAAEAFSACLRMELKDWGIAVTTANPTFHRTPIIASCNAVVHRVWAALAPATKAEYGEAYFEYMAEKSVALMHENLWDPKNVVVALRSAVTRRRPPAQLLVGVDAQYVIPLCRHLPSWALESLTRFKAFPRMPQLAALSHAA